MRNLIIIVFIISTNVDMYLLQETEDLEDMDIASTIANEYQTEYINIATESTTGRNILESLCYAAFTRCNKVMTFQKGKGKQVCAHHKLYQLVNFASPCEVALQNCIYKAQEERKGISGPGTFFYNDKNKPCQYYLKKGETIEQAVKLYYLDELRYRKYFMEFEKIDKKNKYDFVDIIPDN